MLINFIYGYFSWQGHPSSPSKNSWSGWGYYTTKQVVHTSRCICEFCTRLTLRFLRGKQGVRWHKDGLHLMLRGSAHKGDHCQGLVSRMWERKPRRAGVRDWDYLACSGQLGKEWQEGGSVFGTWARHWSLRWIAKKRPASSGDRSFILKETCPSCFNNKPPGGVISLNPLELFTINMDK